jgi:hypothetical protein
MIRANLWKVVTVIAAVLSAVAGHLSLFPWLPLAAQHYIELAGFVASVVVATWINPDAAKAPAPVEKAGV